MADKVCIDQLVRSRRRTIALMITADATLKVFAPLRSPLSFIEQVVDQKSDWIRRKVAQVSARPKRVIPAFVDGAEFPYLGHLYPFQAYDGPRIRIEEKLLFPRDLLGGARQEMEFWYKQEAAKIIPERVDHYAGIMGVRQASVRMSGARTRWGSCGPKGDVQFSWKLVMAPLFIIDYVVVHELAHLTVRDHSKKFWDKVAEFYPSYRQCRRWLKDHQRMLDVTEE